MPAAMSEPIRLLTSVHQVGPRAFRFEPAAATDRVNILLGVAAFLGIVGALLAVMLSTSAQAPVIALIGLVPLGIAVGCGLALRKRLGSGGAFVLDVDQRTFTLQREARYELAQIELGTEVDTLTEGSPRWLVVHVRGGPSYRIARGYEQDIGALIRLLAGWGVTVKIA
jgi:hypothetical protein